MRMSKFYLASPAACEVDANDYIELKFKSFFEGTVVFETLNETVVKSVELTMADGGIVIAANLESQAGRSHHRWLADKGARCYLSVETLFLKALDEAFKA
jgi:hypothetical protein